MDVVYQAVEGLQFFIPIIAVAVVCAALFLFRGAPGEEEYLHNGLYKDKKRERLPDKLRAFAKKES